MTSTYGAWLQAQHTAITAVIARCFDEYQQGGWSENHITTSVLTTLLGSRGSSQWADVGKHVTWEAHKLSGDAETRFGDIAILVTVFLTKSVKLEGVAFYEAKRRSCQETDKGWEIGQYDALDMKQLSRLHENTMDSQILLFDLHQNGQRIEGGASTIPFEYLSELDTAGNIPHRHLTSMGQPWLNVLGENLCGFRLDFRPSSVTAMKAAIVSDRPPAVIVNAAVSSAPQLVPRLTPLPLPVQAYQNLSQSDGETQILTKKPQF